MGIKRNDKIVLFMEEDEVGVLQTIKGFRRLDDFRKSRVLRHCCLRGWLEEEKNGSFVLYARLGYDSDDVIRKAENGRCFT